MPDILRKIPFTEQLLEAVVDFYCGDEEWERPLADWIKAGPTVKNGALFEMAKARQKNRSLDVWLYVNQEDALVGYSSLGDSNWKWPTENDPRVPVSVIPYVAVQKPFWGCPDEPPKYSTQILEDLIFEARRHTERHPLLGLYVDPRNPRALRAYEKNGFTRFHNRYVDKGIDYISMLLKLPEQPASSVG